MALDGSGCALWAAMPLLFLLVEPMKFKYGRPILAEWERDWFIDLLSTTECLNINIFVFGVWLEGGSYRAIGEILGVSNDRIRQRLHRVKRTLDFLKEYPFKGLP